MRTKFEKLELMEAFVLKVATCWEILVEDDIIASLNHDSSAYASELGLRLRNHLTRDESEAVLTGRGYMDFKSVGEIKGFAKRCLVDSFNPFRLIPKDIGRKIDHFFIIRNLIAHQSRYAMRKYERMMTNHYGMKKIPEPAEFLIARSKKTGNDRWEDFLLAFLECSKKMREIVS